MLFWIPLSVLCAVIIYPGQIVDFFTVNAFDIAVCGLMFLFGIIRVVLSSLQVVGRRFYRRRDLFGIWASFICLVIVSALLYLSHVTGTYGSRLCLPSASSSVWVQSCFCPSTLP